MRRGAGELAWAEYLDFPAFGLRAGLGRWCACRHRLRVTAHEPAPRCAGPSAVRWYRPAPIRTANRRPARRTPWRFFRRCAGWFAGCAAGRAGQPYGDPGCAFGRYHPQLSARGARGSKVAVHGRLNCMRDDACHSRRHRSSTSRRCCPGVQPSKHRETGVAIVYDTYQREAPARCLVERG
jgi:hypothetical protein